MALVLRETNYTLDVDLLLEDGAAAIVADGAGSAILDMGAARVVGDIVIDISAITTGGASDETYTIIAELSDSATHASGIEHACMVQVGGIPAAVLGNRDITSDVGRYILPFVNQANSRQYRFLQLHVDVTGTTPSITFIAHLAIAKSL